jgi:hypothetical protein
MDLYPIPLMAISLSLIMALIIGRQRNTFAKAFVIILSMSLLGITAGQIMGQSRESAVSTIMPSILTLLAGIVIYLVSAKSEQQQMIVAVIIISFTVNLLIGSFWGAEIRYKNEQFNNGEEMQLYRETVAQNIRLKKLIYEKQILKGREALGLDSNQSNNDLKCVMLKGLDSVLLRK